LTKEEGGAQDQKEKEIMGSRVTKDTGVKSKLGSGGRK